MKVCVLLAEGFEEIEAITIVDVLRRADVDVTTLAVDSHGLDVNGSHGISVRADAKIGEVEGSKWNMVVLPGGLPGATTLRDSPAVLSLIKEQHAAGRPLAAICAAPIALGAAGVLDGRKATSYPGFEDQLTGAAPQENRVVRDGTITTSRGPGTSLEFSLNLVAQLCGDDVAAKLGSEMLVNSA